MSELSILKNNFRRKLGNKATFATTFIIPILVVVLGIVANMISKPSFTIGVIDAKPTTASKQVVNVFKETDGIEIKEADPANQKTDIITGYYTAIIKFNNNSFSIQSVKDQHTIDTLSDIVDCYMHAETPVDINELFDTSLNGPQRTVAFIVLFLMVTATINASLITKDKNNGTLRRIKYSPCSATSYVVGNVLYNFIVTYLQFFIAVSVIEILKLNTGITYGNYLLMGIWVTLFATAFGTCMASLFKQELQVNLFATCIALILSLIGGTFITFEKMPAMLQRISVISPIRWFIQNVNFMELGHSWFYNSTSVIILSGIVVILFIISIGKNRSAKVV